MMNSKHSLGYLELTLAQVFLAISIVTTKFLTFLFPIMQLLFLKFLTAFIIILLYFLFSSSLRSIIEEFKKLQKRDWLLLTLQAMCSGFLFNILTLHGLKYTTATIAGIVNSTFPVFIAIFSVLILKERLEKSKFIAILLAMIGIACLSINSSTGSLNNSEALYGLFFLFIAMVPGSLFSIFAKMMKTKLNPLLITGFIHFINLLLFFLITLGSEWQSFLNISIPEMSQLLLYCLSGGVLFFYFWYKGLSHTTANTAALFVGLMPVGTSAFAYIFLDETLSWFSGLGMLAVILSIFIGVTEFRFARPATNLPENI